MGSNSKCSCKKIYSCNQNSNPGQNLKLSCNRVIHVIIIFIAIVLANFLLLLC